MRYKVLIRKCSTPEQAAKVAEELAKWSGSSAASISAALMTKNVCIKREAEEAEALSIKKRFEAFGAVVDLEKTAEAASAPTLAATAKPVAAATAASAAAEVAAKKRRDDDEEEEEETLRVRSPEEYAQLLKARSDIFRIEKDNKTRNIQVVALIVGLLFGVWLSTYEVQKVATDFFEKLPEERMAKLVKQLPETLQKEKKEKEEEIKTDKKKLTESKKKGAGGRTGGGSDPRARVTRKGVLGIISGQVKGKTIASADVFGKGGFASGIDAILQGVGGLASGGSGGVGRRGAAGIGYGAGYGSGFGGGGGGIDDLIGSLLGGDEGGTLGLKKRGGLDFSEAKFLQGAALTGGRSKASIYRVVMQNIAALRYAYNKRLREKPGLKGRITVKFAIDEFGAVIFAQVVNSSMGDPMLEEEVVSKIKRWAFGKIDKPGDVTEVVYPFVFTQ